MREGGLPPEIMEMLVQSDAKSDALAELEADAMAAAGKGDLEGARRILTGVDYHRRKADIMRPINEALIGTYIGTAADIGGYARQWAAVTYGLAGALAVSVVPG